MKTATIPAVRVAPELRRAAENVLQEGESLSAFVEEAVRRYVESRCAERAFIERRLDSAASTRTSGRYVPAENVLDKLEGRLATVRRRAGTVE